MFALKQRSWWVINDLKLELYQYIFVIGTTTKVPLFQAKPILLKPIKTSAARYGFSINFFMQINLLLGKDAV